MKYLYTIILAIGFLLGCSSQREAAHISPTAVPAISNAGSPADSSVQTSSAYDDEDTTSFLPDSTYDTIVSQYLEAAREHYLSALDARENGDSLACVNEFEAAIANLNEIASFPGIDSSQDFSDLSHSVVGDYEKYIALIDSLGPNTSIFALREKLIQMADTTNGADQDIPKKIITTTSIPLVINGHVEEDMEFLRSRFKDHFEKWLYRAGLYLPAVKKIFKKEGVPPELAYLSFVESGVNPIAQSRAKAVGMWQFIKGTGSLYGLHTNFWYDERRDFIKASKAAARHFKDLHESYGDWYLALAAYNSGPGRVNRAIRRSGTTDFWKMRPFLPKETRNYVPLYIAATVLAMDPKSYGFDNEAGDALEFDEVTINDCVDLSVIAKCAGTDVATIKELNPAILRWCTPPGVSEITLRVPKGSVGSFEERYAAVPDDQKRNEIFHKVHRKETLASIARKYGISATLLADANHVRPRKKLEVGSILMIPVAPSFKTGSPEMTEDLAPEKLTHARRIIQKIEGRTGKDKIVYLIKKGDTLAEIAKQYGVRVSDLRVWNDIPYGKKIRSGANLTLWVPSAIAKNSSGSGQNDQNLDVASLTATGKVQPVLGNPNESGSKVTVRGGDNLKKISRRNHVSIAELRQWNNLQSDVIHPGQKLKIAGVQAVRESTAVVKVSAIAARKDSSKSSEPVIYLVKKGDTLSTIASLFGVSIGNIRLWNKIHGNRIKIGQQLKINS